MRTTRSSVSGMAILNIRFRLIGENEWRVVNPTHDSARLLLNEPEEHPYTLSNEIWDCIEFELKRLRLVGKQIDRGSVEVTINTDDGHNISVPKEVILMRFE